MSLNLPNSKPWRHVLGLIDAGGSTREVAGQAARAAENALSQASNDPAFQATAEILVALPLAARGPGFSGYIQDLGVDYEALSSRAAFLAALSSALDRTTATTDLGELARMELVRALSSEFDARLPALFPETPADVRTALGGLAGGKGFAGFARQFFAGLTHQALSYYLSRALAAQTGEERRFSNDADRVRFEQALRQHAWEASVIVEEYAAGWYGKNIWQGDGPTPDNIRRFASYAFTKLRRELGRRRNDD